MDESKRSFIKQSVGVLAASGLVTGKHAEAVEPPNVPPSMKSPGAGMGPYGSPAKYERKVTRALIRFFVLSTFVWTNVIGLILLGLSVG